MALSHQSRRRSTVSPHTLTPGVLFQLVREGQAASRAELARTPGLARSTVSARVDALLGLGLLVERGGGTSTGGRPPTQLAFDAGSGVVLCADLGATHCRLAVSDLECTVQASLPTTNCSSTSRARSRPAQAHGLPE